MFFMITESFVNTVLALSLQLQQSKMSETTA